MSLSAARSFVDLILGRALRRLRLLLLLLRPAQIVEALGGERGLQLLLHVALSEFGIRLLKRVVVESPLNPDRFCYSLDQNLVVHGFTSELGKVSVCELYISGKAALVKVDVFDFAKR